MEKFQITPEWPQGNQSEFRELADLIPAAMASLFAQARQNNARPKRDNARPAGNARPLRRGNEGRP